MPLPGTVSSGDIKSQTERRHAHIERALLRVDVQQGENHSEGQITPHLIDQLIQYAPDKDELAEYLSYTGPLSDLTDEDKFCYRMARIPGYLDRLKSMSFKATFDEKCHNVSQVS